MTGMCSHGGETAVRKGPWTLEEDLVLVSYICQHGEGSWDKLARTAGLNRNGKSCRLRWLNYLRPGVRRGSVSPEEDVLIRELHSRWGNKWSKIAKHLPGRTDNEIKNYWRTRIQKKSSSGCARHTLLYYQNAMATTTSEASTASASQAGSTVDDGHVQSSCPGTADVDAMTRQFFSDGNDSFWNIVDNFWAASPVLDTV